MRRPVPSLLHRAVSRCRESRPIVTSATHVLGCCFGEENVTVLLPSRVYECNKRCKCNVNMCTNRLVQHGLQVRLQLFKTQNKGWGIRCLDDIAKGSFVCIYAGRSSPCRGL